MNSCSLTVRALREALQKDKILLAQILNDLKMRCDAVDPEVHAFARKPFFDKLASETLREGVLGGIPVVVKDNICSSDDLTECCSKILEGFVSPYDATVIVKLREAGALLLGKANMDEFAFGSSCETSAFFPTKNPWDLSCVPGGSSGGSAACVAADMAMAALGSDTGGSIRQPASFCGVVGIKPTYGRVSRYGLIAFASSLDQIGPLTKDVRDAALLLGVIAGYDQKDSTSANVPVPDYLKILERDVRGLRVALPREYFVKGMDAQVRDAFEEAKGVLEGLGVKFSEVDLPATEYAVATYYIIATAEASSNLARFDGVQYGLRRSDPKGAQSGNASLVRMYKETRGAGFGAEAKRRIILGTYALSSGYYDAYYARAAKVRRLIKQDFDRVFSEFDLIMAPTSPTPAFKLGEKMDDPLGMYLSDIYTIPANLAGIPALSVPAGFSKTGLPIGMQIMGKPFGEGDILSLAYQYEQKSAWHKMKPRL